MSTDQRTRFVVQIKGDRICRHCKGLCHEGSWRTTYLRRQAYFCRSCRDRMQAFETLERGGFYERVDVISR